MSENHYMGNYYSPMDRGYDSSVKKENPLSEIRIRNIGISTPPFGDQLDGLKARIFQGASTVELGFTGAGKGNMQGHQTTPEMFDAEEREAIRDLAIINKVKLSTHASIGMGPLSGLTQQGFDNATRERTLREIEKAIDFAGDTAGGGAVVVHTGEFQRPLTESSWNKESKAKFRMFEKEDKEAVIQFVDKLTGQVQSISKNMSFMMPEWERNKETNKLEADPELGGWPKPKAEIHKDGKIEFKMEELNWDKLIELTKWYNKENQDALKKEAKGQERSKWELTPAQALLRLNQELQLQNSQAIIKEYEKGYVESDKVLNISSTGTELLKEGNIKGAIEEYKKVTDDPQEKKDMDDRFEKMGSDEERAKALRAQFKNWKDQGEKTKERYGPTIMSHHQQAANMREGLKRLMPVEDYAIEKTAETIARAAEFAHRKSDMLKQNDPKHFNSPIYVSPENIFPETYGSHPEELKNIILKSREKFVEMNKGQYGEEKAKKLAAEHIKATLDIGHAYTWRKYFDDSKYKDPKKADEAFNDWMFKEIDKLNEKKLIGHVHIADNFGWEDEHVTPGQGRAPIKEFIDRMKKAGINEVITEPAHQDYKAMLGSWREFGAPVYSTDGSARRWTEVEHSYFGQTRTPYFIFGEYAPSQQEFSLWTQVPLE